MTDKAKEYYNNNAEAEWNRLNNPYSRIEFECTLHLIDKYFSKNGQ